MVVGILQVRLSIDGAESLKDKRRLVMSVKDRLHREHQVSVAEVDLLDDRTTAVLGITMASNSVAHCQGVLDGILGRLRTWRGCALADQSTQILTGQ
ncbi:MAG: DUF503 domain-containing protein [Planctomycetota bacterium]|nr:DUF503 domain-containing protein [Planctomycetota bacterium]